MIEMIMRNVLLFFPSLHASSHLLSNNRIPWLLLLPEVARTSGWIREEKMSKK